MQELQVHIVKGLGTINGALLQSVMQNFGQQLQQCIEGHGCHLHHVIFKKGMVTKVHSLCWTFLKTFHCNYCPIAH
jgi:hypothetical protein